MRSIVNLGVIVGRFQVHQLHEGHKYLIEHVIRNRSHVLVLVGSTNGLPTQKNPLDFETRKKMIKEAYPEVEVAEILDRPLNSHWSENVDNTIESVFAKRDSVTLFGSRDSFMGSYSGKYKTQHVPPLPSSTSGTGVRNGVKTENDNNEHFRKGMIYAQNYRLPISYQTIDVIVVNDEGKILLGQKDIDGDQYRFVGGFVEPHHTSLEHAVRCELSEEVLELETHTEMEYIGSARVNDYRYRGSEDSILTSLFMTKRIYGRALPGEELSATKWFSFEEVENNLVSGHRAIWKRFSEKIRKQLSNYQNY